MQGPDKRRSASKPEPVKTPRPVSLSLGEVEQLLGLLADATDDGVWWLEYDRQRMVANEALARTFGYSIDELDASVEVWQELIHPDDRERVAAVWERARSGQGPASYLARIRQPDGSYHQTSTVGRVFYDDGDAPRIAVAYVRDLSARLRSEAMTQRFFTRTPELLALIDFEGTLELINPAWGRSLGWSAEQLIGERFESLVHDDELARMREATESLRAGTELNDVRCRIRRADGSWCWVAFSYTPLVEDGQVIAAGRDLTAQLAAEAALVEAREQALAAREQALAASAAKSEFLATMSHEIRTPLNGVIGLTSLLLEGSLSDEQRNLADTLKRSGETLLAIVNDVLDLSKIEAGRLTPERTLYDPHELIEDTAQLFGEEAQRKSLELAVHIAPEVPRVALGDPTRVRQVLVNLLSNGLKFTTKGGLELTASQRLEQGAPMLQLEIADSGCGIQPDKLETIFDPFAQADSSTTRRFGGSGLGLAITRQLLQLMGGSIAVESRLGVGSRFVVELPMPAPPPADRRRISGEHRPLQLAGSRVLLAEDNAVNQLVARKQLERLGCQVEIADNGEDALAALQQRPFDLVLMDCQMPVLDGYAATRAIRALGPPLRDIPVIALTANALAGDRQRCLDAGMDDFMTKPFRPRELQQLLERWLGGGSR
jgi:PAS domain S-box-containing protein